MVSGPSQNKSIGTGVHHTEGSLTEHPLRT